MDSLARLMVRAFASGVGRKLAYVAVGLVVALVAHCAHAMGTVSVGPVQEFRYGANSPDATRVSPAVYGDEVKAGVVAQGCPTVASACVSSSVEYFVAGAWTMTPPPAGAALNITGRTCKLNQASVNAFGAAPAGCGGGGPGYQQFPIWGELKTVTGCPANSAAAAAGSCTCNVGFQPNAGGATQCVVLPTETCKAAVQGLNDAGSTLFAQGATGGFSACFSGCLVRGAVGGQDATGLYVAGPFTTSGAFCNGSNPAAGNDGGTTPTPLTSGNCPGSINGTPVPGGVPCSSATSPTTAASGVSGSASSPSGAVPGTTSSSGSTTCAGGYCTTTTTTTTNNSNGTTTTGTATESSTKSEFCAKNPGNAQCKGTGGAGGTGDGESESSWGGSCSAFTCSGDAIQCAIAQDQYKRNCTLFDNVTPEVTQGLAYIAEGAASSVRYASEDIDIGARFSVIPSNPFGSSCPPDQVIAGLSIPLSRACTALQLLGAVAVALTVLMSAMWLVNKGV